ncbi:6320_t:CDS:2 [Dentiscutata erythropus]|uniref:6320_t:CDS:1 n=1 Tax=Dentiscutata erythropus TaxID=1348616 RepID=A0A9N9CTS6_9GLOM|nr:6320_t:CDS:2 [Dentiscutata erythropus]
MPSILKSPLLKIEDFRTQSRATQNTTRTVRTTSTTTTQNTTMTPITPIDLEDPHQDYIIPINTYTIITESTTSLNNRKIADLISDSDDKRQSRGSSGSGSGSDDDPDIILPEASTSAAAGGFLFPPFWWFGSFYPRDPKYETDFKWKRYNRLMSIFSLFFITLIIGIIIWYLKSDMKAVYQ